MSEEYLTLTEAAEYTGTRPAKFRKEAVNYGISSRTFMGVKQYRKSDIDTALGHLWQLGSSRPRFPLDVHGAIQETRDLIAKLMASSKREVP